MKKIKHIEKYILTAIIAAVAILFLIVFYQKIQTDQEEQALENAYQAQIVEYEAMKSNFLDDHDNLSDDTGTFLGVAWITIPDTLIDFPVAQGEDNEFYLKHDIDDSYSSYGVPFLDYRNQLDFSDFNSILYGHNITKGRMFSGLTNFKDRDFFNAHEEFSLILKDGMHKVEVLACLVVNHTDFVYTTVFLTDAEKLEFLNKIQEEALYCRNFTLENMLDKRLLTLSTCSYEFEEARTVLIGVISEEVE